MSDKPKSAALAEELARQLRTENCAACRIPVVVNDERFDVRVTPVPVSTDATVGVESAAALMRSEIWSVIKRYDDVSAWTTLGVLRIVEHDVVEALEERRG